ncbi:unnamed protein product [Trichogramma brassicae]|uniref:Topoisomerase 6 subunit A/Spo11 TOPRIM domain-containing protein n=1 Tax=Trichogramma brassicae TaxID=86971 RepID=A0A6H5IBW7_9HYME|nr:unnamed protein product [Trichogramma brassicae]
MSVQAVRGLSRPWCSDELRRQLRERDRLYRTARRCGGVELLLEYLRVCKELKIRMRARYCFYGFQTSSFMRHLKTSFVRAQLVAFLFFPHCKVTVWSQGYLGRTAILVYHLDQTHNCKGAKLHQSDACSKPGHSPTSELPQQFHPTCFLVKRIEDLARELVTNIAKQKIPSFEYDDGRNSGWSSCSSGYHSTGDARERRIRFNGNAGRQKFALLLHILNDAHRNLVNYLDKTDDAFYRTKRALFYMMKNEPIKRFVKKQAKVEWGIKNVTLLLDCSPWEIGYISTSKGLIAGDLTLHLKNPDRVIQFEQQTCRAVPDVVANISHIRTTAEFVLVVEKDSVFQKLKSEDCPKYNNCILVTGKGYPDIPTRMFVSLLSSKLKLPVYALVDANPYGFEIMCVYRYEK